VKVYLFGWPGTLGGAATKFAHLIRLLRRKFEVTVVAPRAGFPLEARWAQWMRQCAVRHCEIHDLPRRLNGWGVSLCDSEFLGSPEWADLRRRGLKMAWGNEMMWPLAREAGAITLGQVDAVLYVSPVQRAILEPQYRCYLKGALRVEPPAGAGRRVSGWIEGRTRRERLRWAMVGNYIDPELFPFRDRSRDAAERLTVGRLSRPDPNKFPPDFPGSYEALGLKRPKFRVMGWSAEMQAQWPDHSFDERWELLEPSGDTASFLQSLDLFVYELGPHFRESWGRVVVEAMLTGAIPLVPRGGGHHVENLVRHGRSGFACADRKEFARHARYLEKHPLERLKMSRRCRESAVRRHCNVSRHLRLWEEVFHGC